MSTDLMRDLIPFTNPAAFWMPNGSRFGLYWPWRDLPGLQVLGAIQGTHNNLLTESLLTWELNVNGAPATARNLRRHYWPWAVVETATYGDFQLAATYIPTGADALCAQMTITNVGDQAAELSLKFATDAGHNRPLPNLPIAPWPDFPPPTLVEGTRARSEQGGLHTVEVDYEVYFFYADCDLPGWKGMTPGDRDKAAWAVELPPTQSVSVAPGKTVSFVVRFGFGFGLAAALERAAQVSAVTFDEAQVAYDRRVVEPASLYSGPDQRLYRHSLAGMDLSLTTGAGGFWGRRRVTLAAKYRIVGMFFWDTAFTMTGLREYDPAAAWDSAFALMENLSEIGEAPHTLTDVTRGGAGQAPVMSWAALKLYQRDPNREHLAKLFPLLEQANRYWTEHQRGPSGLVRWHNAGQSGADNCTRWDPFGADEEVGNMLLGDVESADINAYVMLDLRCLARIAETLGEPDRAARWNSQADELGRLIVERLYFPEEAMFFDVRAGATEPFTRARVPANFIPLWAGAPLPAEETKRVIETHLLNPDEFWGAYPFPSLAYDDPKYNPSGYWRGRMWPHMSYWMIETLWANGYQAEAEEAARRLIRVLKQTPYLHENYPSDGYGIYGLPEYNWTCACANQLLLERYKEPRF